MADYNVDPLFSTNAGPPNMAAQLFGMLSGIPDAYQQGVKNKFERGQMARTEELQKPILGADGQPSTNYSTLLREYLKRAGGEAVPGMLPGLIGVESNKAIYNQLGAGGGGGGTPPGQTSGVSIQGVDPNIMHDAAGEPRREGSQPGEPVGRDDVTSLRGMATQYHIDVDSPAFKKAFGGIPLDREDFHPSVVSALDDRLKNFAAAQRGDAGGASAALGPAGGQMYMPGPGMQGAAAGAPPMQTAQAAPAPSGPPSTPVGNEDQARFYEDRGNRRLAASALYGASPKAAEAAQKAAEADLARAKAIRETSAKYGETLDPRMRTAKAETKLSEDIAAAKGKHIAAAIDLGGPAARGTLNTLDVMEDAFRHGGTNISTGPGAEAWLKVKQATNNIVPGFFQGVPEAETVQKLNAYLASEAAKSMTARPSQLEFKAFMANNPGLLTSREGSAALINVLRQIKQQELDLSRRAMRVTNPNDWPDIEDKFYRDNPLKSPFTGKPLTGETNNAAPVQGARKAPDGNWYLPDPQRPGKYLQVK